MSSTTQVQWRRGTSADNNAFAGASGELSVDLTDYRVHVHDGSGTLGGWPAARMLDINNLSGILQTEINNVSGGAVILPPGLVYSTGAQNLSGIYTFKSGVNFNQNFNIANIFTYTGGTNNLWIRDINNMVSTLPCIRQSFDENQMASIYWDTNRSLLDSATFSTVNWQTKLLSNSTGLGYRTVDWGNRYLHDLNDTSNHIALDWGHYSISGNWGIQSGIFTENISLTPSIQPSNLTLSNAPFYINTGNSVVTWTLPAISATNGRVYQIKNRGNTINLTGTANDKIFAQYPVLNFTINSGEAYQLMNDGQYWNIG